MNKFFTKVATLCVGLAMATGVGVAVNSKAKDVKPVEAASATWNKITSTPVSGTKYLILSSDATQLFDSSTSTIDSTSNHVALTGTSSSTTSITGDYDSKAWDFTLDGSTWYISRTLSSTTTYIGRSANSNGITTATSTGSTVANTITNSSGAYTIKGSASRYLSYNTSSGRFRYFASGTVMLFEKAASPQTISGASSAYTDETVTLSSNASSTVTWSIVTADTDAAGAAVTSGGVVSVTGAGTVKVKAVASGYADATHTITFSVRPAGTYYDVTFDSNGGSSSPAKQSIKENATFTFPSPGTKTHYSFDGWSSDGGSTLYDEGDTSPAVVNDIEYTAYWTEDAKYTVTYVAGDHGTGSDYVVSNQYAGSYTLATFATAGFTASSGYSFTKWSVGGGEYAEGASITLSANTTVTALYEEIVTYTLVTDASQLKDGTTFVLVGYSSNTYRIANNLNSGHQKMNTITSATTISNGVSSGSTLVTSEADVFTLTGSTGAWEIKRGDTYLQFTGTSNGNDSFTDSSGTNTKFTISSDGTSIDILSNSQSSRYWRYNTSTGDLRNGASSYGVDIYMFAVIPPSNELDSVTTSGQTTSFTAGNNFSYGGTLTAHYTLEEAATVTPTSYKYGDSGIDPTTSGTSITTSTTLTKAEHDGKYIYVIYTEDDITKYCSYQITVDYAAVTSVEIGTHTAEIGLNKTYDDYLDPKKVSVTVNSEYANQGYEWIVSATTVGNDYAFDESGLLSGDTEGTITLRCRSTADNSKYDELVVTVTGDPTADFAPASVSGYVGKSDDVAFTYGNMSDTSLISITSSNSSIVEVDEFVADAGEGLVTVNFVAVGSATLSISYNGGSALNTVTVTVSADSVVALNWTASNIKVYSGAVLPVAIEDTWMVNYEMASGDSDFITYSGGDYSVKLGGSTITLPHTWVADDDGKTLCVEYGGVQSSTVSVDVTQTLQSVMADITSESTYTFSASTWTYSEGSGEWSGTKNGNGYTSGQGVQMTTSQDGTTVTSASSYSNISQIVITYNTNKSSGAGSFDVKVGTNTSQNVSAAWQSGDDGRSMNYTATFDYATKQSGVVAFTVNVGTNSLWVKSIKIVTSTGSTNIANVAGHEAAQKAVVAFAKAMNAAFNDTANCTDGVADAWSTASSAYSSNITDNASLSAEEKAYAKNLIKYASAQYTDNTDNDYSYCLERAMATYEACIQKHGQTAFMSDVRLVSPSSRITSLSFTNGNGNTVAIIVIVSLISVTAIGGYFFY